ncbi:MAG: ABC transporter permease [Ruminiclostridium sp.]|nr:ABC transporter permease [Ruminiclostridium sp.]
MQVFKLCMNIIKKNLGILMIYVIVFIMVSLIMSANMNQDMKKITSFNSNKADIAFISEESSTLINGFKEELGKVANFVEIPDKTEDLQDALFFRTVSYILRVPKGFTESFMSGEAVQLEKTIVPDSFSNTYIDLSIDQYLNAARVYVTTLDGITQEELVAHLKADLVENALVEVKTNGEKTENQNYANYFFNYFSYSLLSVIIMGMSALMLVFNKRDLKLRNGCSPISTTSMNLQFILGNLVFTFSAWLLMVLLCLVVNYKNSSNLNTVYFILNSFVFALCCASISYLIGNLVKSPNTVSMICNVVALGLSFISGAFVPQELLGGPVLKIASFGPTYWFIKANNAIAQLSQFDYTHLKPIFSDMLILICFTVAFFSVALVIGKKRRYS